MSQYKTVISYSLTGGRDFTIPFEYLARKFIQVTLVGDGIRTLLALNTDYRFSTRTQITTNQSWPVGQYREIEIRRFTSATDRLVNFNDGSILRATDLNLSQIQTLHVAEEARDLTIDLLSLDSNGNFDARNLRIVNVADAVNPQDAVTLKQATVISENLFYPPKDFVAGLSITSNKDTVLYLGAVYSASPAAIPFETTATFNPTQWLVFSNVSRAELAQPTGADIIGGVTLRLQTYDDLRAYTGPSKTVIVMSRSSVKDGGYGVFTEVIGGSFPDDDGVDIVTASGRRFTRENSGPINVLWYGAKSGPANRDQAVQNTLAFRRAHKSFEAAWAEWKTRSTSSLEVFTPAGDYTLSNGFTVPKGVRSFGAGIGTSRLKVLSETADVGVKLPLCTMGPALAPDLSFVTISGTFVVDPAPSVDGYYLNPQNSGTALAVMCPGFSIGTLWIQADIGVNFAGAGDGVIDKLVLEDSTGTGVFFNNCQNIMINQVYTFLCRRPVVIGNSANNVHVTSLQANYTLESVVSTLDGTTSALVSIGNLVCNQNVQYPSFTSVVRTRSMSCDIKINNMDARNYNGWAINNETGLGNSVKVGKLLLTQIPNSTDYGTGNAARGIRVNNSNVSIDFIDARDLTGELFEYETQIAESSSLSVGGGVVRPLRSALSILKNTGTKGSVTLTSIINAAGIPLFTAGGVPVNWSNITNPFPMSAFAGTYGIKLPFVIGDSYEIMIGANTSASSNPLYYRKMKFGVVIEAGYVDSVQTITTAVPLLDSGGTGYTPSITPYLDVNAVGAGRIVPYVGTGWVYVTIPSAYTNVQFKVIN